MSLSRRKFFQRVGAGGVGALSASLIAERASRALASLGLSDAEIEAVLFAQEPADLPVFGSPIPGLRDSQVRFKLHGNENPSGPGRAALEALKSKVDAGTKLGWYPQNYEALRSTIAKTHGAKPENILLSTASGPILIAVTRAFTSPSRALVSGMPSYEGPESAAKKIGTPIKSPALDKDLRLDLQAMTAAAKGAGLVFICNPNNPTATAHSGKALADVVQRVRTTTPDTAVLVDEAYIHFADDPAAMTAVPLALANPKVVVSRTFSKAYGMGNLRLGYAVGQPDTLAAVNDAWGLGSISGLTGAAAIASLTDPAHMEQVRQNYREARAFTMQAFKEMGYRFTESQANFLFVDVRRPVREFREACIKEKILVARDFPGAPTWCRISIGTMDQMKEAVPLFRKVLGGSATSAAGA